MLGDMEAGEMKAHICDKCGDIYTAEWRLEIEIINRYYICD